MNERGQDGVKHMVQVFTGIFGKESQNEISILLQQGIFPPLPPVRLRVSHMAEKDLVNELDTDGSLKR